MGNTTKMTTNINDVQELSKIKREIKIIAMHDKSKQDFYSRNVRVVPRKLK